MLLPSNKIKLTIAAGEQSEQYIIDIKCKNTDYIIINVR